MGGRARDGTAAPRFVDGVLGLCTRRIAAAITRLRETNEAEKEVWDVFQRKWRCTPCRLAARCVSLLFYVLLWQPAYEFDE